MFCILKNIIKNIDVNGFFKCKGMARSGCSVKNVTLNSFYTPKIYYSSESQVSLLHFKKCEMCCIIAICIVVSMMFWIFFKHCQNDWKTKSDNLSTLRGWGVKGCLNLFQIVRGSFFSLFHFLDKWSLPSQLDWERSECAHSQNCPQAQAVLF